MPNRLNFTELALQKLSTPGSYWDTIVPAFGIRIGKQTKTFVVIKDGGHRVKLGRYPSLSLRDARLAAKRHLLDQTPDPASLPFLEAFESYLTLHIHRTYRPRSASEVERIVRRNCTSLYKKPISAINTHALTAIFDQMKPSEANHLYGVLRTFFNWAEKRDLGISPLRKLSKPSKEKSRERVLTDDELARIWHACEDNSFGKIVQMLILTGQRRGEIAAVQAGWISLAKSLSNECLTNPTITFPPHITKNGQEHTIPLSPLSKKLFLDVLHHQNILCIDQNNKLSHASHNIQSSPNSTLLFPSSKTGTVITGFAKLKEALDKRCLATDWVLHDIRRTFSTRLAELGVLPHIIERCLNHITGTISPIAKVYNRALYQKEMRDAYNLWDAHLRTVLRLEPLCINAKDVEGS